MTTLEVRVAVQGPWSLATSKAFWEGFTPAALTSREPDADLRTVFRVDADWSRAEAQVSQDGTDATVRVAGDGDLDAAVAQVCRFLSLDVDARAWPVVGKNDPVIGAAQEQLPGLRPCGFHSPYEAAAWSVISQRLRIVQAARLSRKVIDDHGDGGAFPAPAVLRTLDLDLPGRKTEYLHAVADAALDGQLDGRTLHAADPVDSVRALQTIKGIGPFAADLVVLRGANAPDGLPRHEKRLEDEITERYGPDRLLVDVAESWRPFRTWASVHLRALREYRTHEIAPRS